MSAPHKSCTFYNPRTDSRPLCVKGWLIIYIWVKIEELLLVHCNEIYEFSAVLSAVLQVIVVRYNFLWHGWNNLQQKFLQLLSLWETAQFSLRRQNSTYLKIWEFISPSRKKIWEWNLHLQISQNFWLSTHIPLCGSLLHSYNWVIYRSVNMCMMLKQKCNCFY